MYILLDEFKQHINLELDYKEEDSYLLEIIKASEDIVSKRIDKPLSQCLNNEGELFPSVRASILLMGATLYKHREGTTSMNIKDVPYTLSFLFDLDKHYKIY